MINPFASLKARFDRFRRNRTFHQEFLTFKALTVSTGNRYPVLWENRMPCLHERTTTTGYDRHYVLHTAWAARAVAKIRPERHVDISSSLYFSAITSAFIPVDFYDYRPAVINLPQLKSAHADLTALPFPANSIRSISCMHTIEHIGLGRYGDPLDPDGDQKAVAELRRVTAPGGHLLFVSPVGRPKLMFNAHRIYSYEQVLAFFPGWKLTEFALIPDSARTDGILYHADPALVAAQNYGCGCFWFTKPIS